MARHLLSGIGLGALFSIGVAGAISIFVPIAPQTPPETDVSDSVAPIDGPVADPAAQALTPSATPAKPGATVSVPDDSQAPQKPQTATEPPTVSAQAPAAETTPVLDDQTVVTAPASEAAPSLGNPTARPRADEAGDTVPQMPNRPSKPQAVQAADLSRPRGLPSNASARAEGDAPVLPNPQALAPMIPDDAPDATVSTDSAPPPDEPEEETFIVVLPVPDAPAQTGQSETADASETTPTDSANEAEDPQTEEVPKAEPEAAEAEKIDEENETRQVVRPRVIPAPNSADTAQTGSSRPRIGRPASTLFEPVGDDAVPDAPETDVVEDSDTLPPVRRFAADFANPDAKPLMSIVLIDDGAPQNDADIGLPALSSFPYPVSIAVDAGLPDAPERMKRYRQEGFEVLAMVDLPAGARPTDAEVSLGAAIAAMPEVVGVMDGTGEGLQSSREVADQVTAILKSEGLGLVAQSKGLDSMPKLAVKEGVAAAAVFRDFDSQDQSARVIRRFLDQAAFKAGQQNGVITLGRLRPETIKALLVWGLADRAGRVALAPVSAVLRAQID